MSIELNDSKLGRQVPTFSDVPEIERKKVLDTSQTAAFVGLSVPHLRRMYRLGRFPRGLSLSERKLGWQVGTLCDWLDSRNGAAA